MGFVAHTGMYMLQCLGAGYVYMIENRLKKKPLQVWIAVMPPISVYNSNVGCWHLARTTQLQYVSDDI